MDRDLKRSLLLLAAVTLVTAWFSELFYFPDEHYQVLEFTSYKLGITPASELPWEFSAHIRPWFQPLLYFLIAKPLTLLGVKDMFVIAFILRLATGFFSLAALVIFARAVLPTIEGEEQQRGFVRYLPLFGFLPYLFVRTSSETLAAAFFTIGLALAMNRRTASRLAVAGLICGLAFECRYQVAFMGLGLFAWLAVIARARFAGLAAFLGGGLCTVLLGALVDRWGYGAWVFSPWDYYQVQVMQDVAVKIGGREPIFAYLYLMPAQFFFAITLVLMVAMVAMWLRNPRHAVTWVTLPFVVAHMVLAHKEARYLFPIAIMATSFPVLGFSPRLMLGREWFTRHWSWRKSWAAKSVTAISLLGMAWFAVYPFGVRPHMPMARYLYRHWPGAVYSFAPPFQSYPIFRPAGFKSERLKDVAQLDTLLNQGPVAVMSQMPLPPGVLAGARITLLYSEFPFARFGYGQAGADYIHAYTAFAARHHFLRLLPLYWYTLYRVERSATIRS